MKDIDLYVLLAELRAHRDAQQEQIDFLEDADDFDDQMRKERCRGRIDVLVGLIERLEQE